MRTDEVGSDTLWENPTSGFALRSRSANFGRFVVQTVAIDMPMGHGLHRSRFLSCRKLVTVPRFALCISMSGAPCPITCEGDKTTRISSGVVERAFSITTEET